MSTRERVDTPENALKELAYAGRRTEMSVEQLSKEMRKLKDENQREFRKMNVRWGTLANKMGTLVEDMALPNFPHILDRYFAIGEVDDLLVRRRKPHPIDRSRRKEFDLIAWTRKLLFWNETKSSPTIASLEPFVEDNDSVFEYFPELPGRRLIKIASALSMAEEVIEYLTAHRCYAMVLGDETMDLINFTEVHEQR